MNRPVPMLFALQKMVSDLSLIDRNHQILGSERHENDINHSFTVALLCWYIHSEHALPLDLTKILKYAMVHDFTELYAGDINTFASKADRQRKIDLEAAALKRIAQEYAGFPDMVQMMHNYKTKADDEALFVWTVDKIQSLVLADLDNWRPYQRIRITYATFKKKHHEQLAACSPYCKDIFESVLEYCKTTFYDRPKGLPEK